jgi:hypothetical protein
MSVVTSGAPISISLFEPLHCRAGRAGTWKEELVNRRQLVFSPKVGGLLGTTTMAFRETRTTRSLAGLSVAMLIFGFLCHAANGQTNEWTWMNGTKTPDPSVYGTLGTPAAKNMPGNRSAAVSWTDNNGNLWLFGGDGADSVGKYGSLNACRGSAVSQLNQPSL